ncbi:MAG: hypothetical protein K9M07_04005 [Simkaniaceae bacterium]|nr:hypothetical protein [Simkaniaceae bacterium]MCF7852391.1 hypothetical protein [Simkaniaceae bacterium]
MSKLTQSASFKAHLDMLSHETQNSLLHFLPLEEMNKIKEMPSFDWTAVDQMPIYAFLSKIHPSWIKPFFDQLSSNDRELFLSAFVKRKEELAKAFQLEIKPIALSPIAQSFILKHLYHTFFVKEGLLPFPFISKDPFFRLLTLSYDELIDLIDLLGMSDMAIELSEVIQGKQVRAILETFNERKITFLKQIRTSEETVSFGKMHLSSWDQNQEKLKKIIHQRGLNRLAKALCGASEHFLGYLAYMLSKDEAKMFKSFYTKKKNPKVLEVLNKELNRALDFLLTSEE